MGQVQEESVIENLLMAGMEDTSVDMFYVQTSGLYLFSAPVPDRGAIVHIRSFGYVSDESFEQPDDIIPYLYVVVFRHEVARRSYRLLRTPAKLTHGRAPGVLPKGNGVLNITVRRGDRIGAIIPKSCTNVSYNNDDHTLCPSQINLRTGPTVCTTALFHYYNTDTMDPDFEDLESISEDQFEEVQIKLNMEVLISRINGMHYV